MSDGSDLDALLDKPVLAKPKRVRAKPVDHPITDEEWLAVKRYVEKWQPLLGLKTWRIIVLKQRLNTANEAEVEMFLDAKLARIRIGKSWGKEPKDPGDEEKLAIHELLHILNNGMKAFAADLGMADHEDVFAEEHAQINILEELLFKAYGDK